MPDPAETQRRVLVCGATGYVGGRLVRRLLASGYRVRCLVRTPAKLQKFRWVNHASLEVHEGDLIDPACLDAAMRDVDYAYYLVHSMVVAGSDYEQRDRKLAENFVTAADRHAAGRDDGPTAGRLSRIVYLGGLGEVSETLSPHLRSRREVAEILRSGSVPVTELRAAMIIGSGSASFEIVRYLVERLPVMITPIWVQTPTQPIAIRDVLRYLVDCLDVPETAGRTLDIGNPDVVTYREMFALMANHLELRQRWIIPVPILSPRLSSYWIGYVTPVSNAIARPLSEGLRNPTVCRDDDATKLMPGPLWTVDQAIEAAVGKVRRGDVETRWSTAGAMPGDPDWAGGTLLQDRRQIRVAAPPSIVFDEIKTVGGESGYWGADFLWHLRGWMDQMIGGPGLRRGRRDPNEVHFGETIDFWRVSGYEENRLLKLRAEMKLPGIAELKFEVVPQDDGRSSVVHLHARFRPKGLFGLAYWYGVLPLHSIVFPMMLRGIRRNSMRRMNRSASSRRERGSVTANLSKS